MTLQVISIRERYERTEGRSPVLRTKVWLPCTPLRDVIEWFQGIGSPLTNSVDRLILSIPDEKPLDPAPPPPPAEGGPIR